MMKMKNFKRLTVVIISMLFVVGLCPQTWAKKQTGPSPGKMSVNDLKKNKMIKAISASRLDITPKVVEPGGTLSFRGTIVYSADLIDKINEKKEDPDDYFNPGDTIHVVVLLVDTDGYWIAVVGEQPSTCPEPGRSVTVNFTEKYHVPFDAKQGQVLNFSLLFYSPLVGLAERSVEVRQLRLEFKERRAIDRKPMIKEKPATKQKPVIKQQKIKEQNTN